MEKGDGESLTPHIQKLAMPLPVMWSDEVLFLLSSFRKTRDKLRS
jgi:hypothetical protein